MPLINNVLKKTCFILAFILHEVSFKKMEPQWLKNFLFVNWSIISIEKIYILEKLGKK